MDGYTRGEVAWLLGLTREEAVLEDACQPDSLAHLADEDASDSHTATQEWDPIMTVARWSDVHDARTRVLAHQLLNDGVEPVVVHQEIVIVTLTSWGVTGPEVAAVVGLDRFTTRRRFTGLLRYILDELGGEYEHAAPMLARRADACMKCGVHPRIRTEHKVRRLVDGTRRRVTIERQTSLCLQCLEEAPRRPKKAERVGTLRELREAA